MAPDRDLSIEQIPLVPVEVLKRHHVHERDTRFRAAARLLQSLWRERQGLPCGALVGREGRKRRLGSRLTTAAADIGRNFMSPAVAHLARREVAYQEAGALIEQGRLFGNLLSSMPLAFNAFAPLHFDRALAARSLRALLPGRDIAAVRNVRFEHSPGRRDTDLTDDDTAFDVALVYERGDGALGIAFVEVKYADELGASHSYDLNTRYDGLAHASGLFKEPNHAVLRVSPLRQLFREHLLAQASLMRGDYAEAMFILIAPRHNRSVQRAAGLYASFLAPPVEGQVPFLTIELEQYLSALYDAGARDEAVALVDRYLDWRQIDAAVEQALVDRAGDWTLAAPARKPLRLVGEAA